MFRIDSEQSFIAAFRPKDRAALELPDGVRFPLFVRNYLAWTDPAGVRAYLLVSVGKGAPTGIVFRRDQQGGEPGVSRMCEWCHATGPADRIGLLTADRNARKRVGISLCLDLSCKDKLEDAANRGGRSALDATKQLLERIGRFAEEALQIDLSGAGRD